MNEIEKFAGLIPRFTTYDCEYTCEKHGKVKGFYFELEGGKREYVCPKCEEEARKAEQEAEFARQA